MKFGLPKSKKSIAKTLLRSYVAVILVCTVVISIIAVRYESIIREESSNLSQYLFSSVSKSVNWALDDIQTLNAQIAKDKSIQSIINAAATASIASAIVFDAFSTAFTAS